MSTYLSIGPGRTIKHALLLVLVITAASSLFSCGQTVENGSTAPSTPTTTGASPQPTISLSVSLPAPAAPCSDGAPLAAGIFHTAALRSDGTVTAVGSDSSGQVKVGAWTNINAIAAGAYHTVGLRQDGTVAAVGSGNYDQLKVSGWTAIKAVAAGAAHTIGLKEDGTVVAVGSNDYSQLKVSAWTDIKAIAAGPYHTVGLRSDGTVTAVGYNGSQLKVGAWTNIKAIAAGSYHTVGLKEDGTVVAVGTDYGQMKVSSWANIKAIAAGPYHTVGLREDGTVVAVGVDYGQLKVSTWTNIKAIAAGGYHTVGLKDDGTVVAVGTDYGQLKVSPWSNIMPVCEASCAAAPDLVPPDTASLVTGTQGTNGWYVSEVLVTLSAADNEGGSGVKEIHYIVDGAETVVQGNLTAFSIPGDGTHTVSWYAVDNAGNAEPLQTMDINIDTAAPALPDLADLSAILWPPNGRIVTVSIGGYKDLVTESGSGIDSATVTVTDEYGIYDATVSGFNGVIRLEASREGADKDGRLYTIQVVVTDNAGNRSAGSTKVLVPHDMKKK